MIYYQSKQKYCRPRYHLSCNYVSFWEIMYMNTEAMQGYPVFRSGPQFPCLQWERYGQDGLWILKVSCSPNFQESVDRQGLTQKRKPLLQSSGLLSFGFICTISPLCYIAPQPLQTSISSSVGVEIMKVQLLRVIALIIKVM